MGALFFGTSAEPLFGFYHPARPSGGAGKPRDTAVLLCPSTPQEYLRMHWAFRRLADALSRQGYPVLRFDYFGTGDSAGEPRDASLERWRRDIEVAARELRDLASTPKLAAVGLRVGAQLASSADFSWSQLVLWDPVSDGSAYLRELEAAQRGVHEQNPAPPERLDEELLGYPLTTSLRAELVALRFRPETPPRAGRARIVVSEPAGALRALESAWSDRGVPTTLLTAPDPSPRPIQFQSAWLPNEMIQAIVSSFE